MDAFQTGVFHFLKSDKWILLLLFKSENFINNSKLSLHIIIIITATIDTAAATDVTTTIRKDVIIIIIQL